MGINTATLIKSQQIATLEKQILGRRPCARPVKRPPNPPIEYSGTDMARLSFSIRFAILAFGAIALCTIVSAWLVYRATVKSLTETVGLELLGTANAAALLINAQVHADLNWDNSTRIPDEEARRRLLRPLESVLQTMRVDGAMPSLQAYRRSPGFASSHELELVVFAGTDTDRRPYPGKRCLAGVHHFRALQNKPYQTGAYSDFDGTWISATAPIHNKTGQVVGLIQADLPAAVVGQEAGESLSLFASAGAICALLVLLPAFLWGHFTDRRLDGLSDALELTAEGELRRYPILDKQSHIGRIITNFNHLIDRLKAARQDTDIKLRALVSEGQQARRCGQSQMEFLANVSHEMRNTINGVIGLNQILLDTPLSPEQHDLGRTVQQSSQSLLTLLNDILDYSKIESGNLSFADMSFDLRSVVENTLESFAPQAQQKGLELVGWVDDSVPGPLRGDPGRIRQVLSNLISNAIKYTPSGEVMLAVLAADVTDHDVLLNVNVRDTGVGVPESAGPYLFQVSGQMQNHAARQSGGTGLGLAISRKIVETLHGSIGFESGVGRGSTFWFTMRLSRADTSEVLPRLDPDAAHGLRILIVDDNPTFLKIIGQQLASIGARFETVSDGVDALRYLHRDAAAGVPHSLLLVDAHLDGMDALTLARTIHADSKIAQTKIVLLTHMSDRKESTDFRHRSIWTCLRKPIRRGELFEVLSKVIEPAEALAQSEDPAAAPSYCASAVPPPIVPMPAAPEIAPRKSCRVLLAEDDRINQRLTRHLLNRQGFGLEIVTNGREAVQAATSQSFDVILMDCFMPDMDGYDAVRAIRSQWAAAASAPNARRRPYIIAMTAQALDGDREKCLAAGMDDYISKPVEPEALRDAMVRAEAYLESRAKAA